MVNFIKHFNGWMSRQTSDVRLTAHHITLYFALFHYWNLNRFCNPLTIRRDDLMKVARIGSRNTYARCLQDLDQWNYIVYQPCQGAAAPGKFHLLTFDTSLPESGTANGTVSDRLALKSDTAPAQKEDGNGITSDTLLLNNINNSNSLNRGAPAEGNEKKVSMKKTDRHAAVPSSLDEVKTFFSGAGAAAVEAEKFYYHYQSNGWKVGGRAPMQNWLAAACKWILNAKTIGHEHSTSGEQKTVNKKNYAEPL